MHFVLIRFSSLGDVVIQTAFISWLKSQFSNCKITFVTSSEFTGLVEGHPHIDHVVGYKKAKGLKDLISLRALSKKIDQQHPVDFIIDLHGTTRSYFYKFLSPNIPAINLDKRRFERFLLVKFKIDLLKKEKTLHSRVIDDYQGLFNKYFSDSEQDCLTSSPISIVKDKEAKEEVAESIKPFEQYIILAPVASFAPKRWAVDNFIQLAKTILNDSQFNRYGVAIVAGPNDDYVDSFNQLNSLFPDRFINYKGKTNLSETSKIIRYSSLLIGNDTGMGHIAESFNIPIISIFGPTSESFGFAPHLKNSDSISVDLWCRPCSTTGKKKCFRSKQLCMENVTIDSVFNLIKTKLL